jgi:hypothetical protein
MWRPRWFSDANARARIIWILGISVTLGVAFGLFDHYHGGHSRLLEGAVIGLIVAGLNLLIPPDFLRRNKTGS